MTLPSQSRLNRPHAVGVYCSPLQTLTKRWLTLKSTVFLWSLALTCYLKKLKKNKKCIYFFLFFKIVHLGIALSEVEDGSQRVIFYYTDPRTRGGTKEVASFKMGDLTGRWARFTLTVQGAEVGGVCSFQFGWVNVCVGGISKQVNHDSVFFFSMTSLVVSFTLFKTKRYTTPIWWHFTVRVH